MCPAARAMCVQRFVSEDPILSPALGSESLIGGYGRGAAKPWPMSLGLLQPGVLKRVRWGLTGLIIAGTPVAFIAAVALWLYGRTRVLAFLFIGVGSALIVVGTVSPAWPFDRMLTQCVMWPGFLCFGWGIARSNTVDSAEFQQGLPKSFRFGRTRPKSARDAGSAPGVIVSGLLIVAGLVWLYVRPHFSIAGYGMILLGVEFLVAHLLYSGWSRIRGNEPRP
jgi:hypothetical protein